MSGGRATRRFQKGESVKVQMGDICAVDPMGFPLTDKYYLECKHYKELRLDGFILTGKGPLQKFWDRINEEAERYRRTPMLIAKQNNMPVFVLMTTPRRTIGIMPILAIIPPANCAVVLFDDLLACKPMF